MRLPVLHRRQLPGAYRPYRDVILHAAGLARRFRQFPLPGSIHEGGEPGFGLSHARGAACDNPDRPAARGIGEGEAVTGPGRRPPHGT
ncbi:hypothetical protein ACFVY4_33300 [Streptomyces sp. NPDC058299]|uniref:hypothetical protein n=1 Tax=Streptomyces sp. NPDC058299 TaxID=3346435 RepID=UPI0036EE5CE3